MRIHLPVAALVALVSIAGCLGSSWPKSVITTNPDGLRVFSWVREWNGAVSLCAGPASREGLRGTLAGDETAALDAVWLVAPDGRRLSIVWPGGYRVSFSPTFALLDERGVLVAGEGDTVHLIDVDPNSAVGTMDDPYIARGWVFEGCYPYTE